MNANSLCRKWLLVCSFLLCSMAISTAQVGIGTTSPDASAALDISSPNSDSGVLFPRLTTAQRDAIASPASGLLIYNTDDNALQYNFGTPGSADWVSIKSDNSVPRSVKYSYATFGGNPDLNGSTSGTVALLFTSLEWNDDTTLYQKTANGFLTVTEAGRYRIVVNIDMEDVNGSSNLIALSARIRVNSVPTGVWSSTGLFVNEGSGSGAAENQYSSINFEDTLELSAGDSISVIVVRDAETGTVNFSGSGFSNIFIEKIE